MGPTQRRTRQAPSYVGGLGASLPNERIKSALIKLSLVKETTSIILCLYEYTIVYTIKKKIHKVAYVCYSRVKLHFLKKFSWARN